MRAKLVVSVLVLSSLSFGQQLPTGWRKFTRDETASPWRTKSRTRFVEVRGDFDGDGKADVAELLLRSDGKEFCMFAWLSSDQKWRQMGKSFSIDAFDRFGIDYVKPGKYETACGKGYGDFACANGDPDWLKLSRPAVDLFYTESSDSIFYWDKSLTKFKEVLMSD